MAYLRAAIFPPVGTEVTLPDGKNVQVEGLHLNLNHKDQIARITITVSEEPAVPA